jgi:3-hydroxyisobutyrate dehydrogenase-like beta-hydroxyacid dehydrogenase
MPALEEQKCVGVTGLGLMGAALTERLLHHGCRVAVWNRAREKAVPLLALLPWCLARDGF